MKIKNKKQREITKTDILENNNTKRIYSTQTPKTIRKWLDGNNIETRERKSDISSSCQVWEGC